MTLLTKDSCWSVLLLDTKQENPNHYIVLSILDALRRHPRVTQVDKVNYTSAIRMAQARHYDVLLAVDGEAINIDILSRLHDLVGTSILWAWEDPYERAITTALAPLFDCVFTNDSESVSAYPRSATYLPLGADTFLPVRTNDADFTYDLSFIGSAWPNRVVLLRHVLRELPDLKVRIVLSYNAHLPKAYLDLPDSSYIGGLTHQDFLGVANRTRVNLTLFRNFSGDGAFPIARSPGPRLFEIALAGGYQLVDTSEVFVEPYFTAEREIDVFNNAEACVEKIRRALADPERRIAMAKAAQVRSAREHSYATRLDVILNAARPRRQLAVAGSRASTSRVQASHPRILFVTHNTVAAGNFGGVEVLQEIVADQLRSRYDVLYYRPALPTVHSGSRNYVLTDSRHNILQNYATPEFDMLHTLSDPTAETNFANILSDHKIDLVHYFHLIHHVPSLPLISNLLGVPSIYTLSDFWMACTRFNLLDHRGTYCAIAGRPTTVCDACLGSTGLPPGAQNARRIFFATVLASFDRIIGNSTSSIEILRGIYPDIEEKRIVTTGLPIPLRPVPNIKLAHKVTSDNLPRPLQVVFLGNFTRIKGADTFLEAAALLQADSIMFSLVGRVDPPYDMVLSRNEWSNIRVEGVYAPGELDLSRFDVSLHLSVWPETYCITLSEAWMAQLVPIVTACGALGDRVVDGVNGYHVPVGGSGEIVDLLRRLAANPLDLAIVRDNIHKDLWMTPNQLGVVWSALYSELITQYPQPYETAKLKVRTGAPTDLSILDLPPMSKDWTVPQQMELPDLSDQGSQPLAPLRSMLERVRNWMAEGKLEASQSLRWRLDSIGNLINPYATDPLNQSNALALTWFAKAPLQLIGWLRFRSMDSFDVMLAAWSVSGDLILRQVYLHDRPDLATGTTEEQGLGFLTDTFPSQILGEGVYRFDLIVQRDSKLESCALSTVVVTPEGLFHFGTSEHGIVRIPQPARAWPQTERCAGVSTQGSVDELDIVHVAAGNRSTAVLKLRGWLISPSDIATQARIALQISGKASFHAELDLESRPDVVHALNTGFGHSVGYRGAICLTGLPSGDYNLELVKEVTGGTIVQVLGALAVPASGKDISLLKDDIVSELSNPFQARRKARKQ